MQKIAPLSHLSPPSQSKLLFFHLRMNSLLRRHIDRKLRLLLPLPKAVGESNQSGELREVAEKMRVRSFMRTQGRKTGPYATGSSP